MTAHANTSRGSAPIRGGLRFKFWLSDGFAGLTLAAIAVPEQMATARLGHFPPQIGLLAFVSASIGFFVFGASRSVSVGADSTITPIFAGSLLLGGAAAGGQSFQTATILAVMVGVIVAIAGLCRLGWVANLLSAPVTCGFLAGIAVHIVSSQLPAFFGLATAPGDVLSRLTDVARNLSRAGPYPVLIACGVLLIIVATEKLDRRWPGALIGVAAATVCTTLLGLQHHGLQVLGAVPPPFPHIALFRPTPELLARLAPLSVLLAFVVMVQTAATTRSVAPEEGDLATIDRDFVGVGLANIAAGLVGSFPVNASPPRSTIVAGAGARSKAAGLVAAVSVALLATLGMSLLAFVPNAALAAILLFIAFRITRFRLAWQIWRQSKPEFALIVATGLAIVLLPIQTGAAIGIILSLLHGVWTATRAQVVVLKRVGGSSVWWPPGPDTPQEESNGLLVLAFQAPLSFLNAETFRKGAIDHLNRAPAPLRLFVLEASSIVEIDFTAAQTLAEVVRLCQDRGVQFAVARLESLRAQESFRRFGVTDQVGNEHFYHSVYEAVEALAPVEAQP